MLEDSVTLTTTDGDPQMILEDVSDMTVRTVSYTVEFDGDAREMCLYYTTKVGEPYSQDRRVFPQALGGGRYLYTLPRTSIVALRLDPCSPDANKTVGLTFSPASITLNGARRVGVFCAQLVPGVLPGALPGAGRRGPQLAARLPVRPAPPRAVKARGSCFSAGAAFPGRPTGRPYIQGEGAQRIWHFLPAGMYCGGGKPPPYKPTEISCFIGYIPADRRGRMYAARAALRQARRSR